MRAREARWWTNMSRPSAGGVWGLGLGRQEPGMHSEPATRKQPPAHGQPNAGAWGAPRRSDGLGAAQLTTRLAGCQRALGLSQGVALASQEQPRRRTSTHPPARPYLSSGFSSMCRYQASSSW